MTEKTELSRAEVAQFIKNVREREKMSTPKKVATINMAWVFWDTFATENVPEPDLTEQEVDEIMSSVPTEFELEAE